MLDYEYYRNLYDKYGSDVIPESVLPEIKGNANVSFSSTFSIVETFTGVGLVTKLGRKAITKIGKEVTEEVAIKKSGSIRMNLQHFGNGIDEVKLLPAPKVPKIGNPPGKTIDPATGKEVGRFIVDQKGNTMIEPVGGKTVPSRNLIDTHTTYPNGSNYQRLNSAGHPKDPTPYGHGHLEGTGPNMKGQGPSIDIFGNKVDLWSPKTHWKVIK